LRERIIVELSATFENDVGADIKNVPSSAPRDEIVAREGAEWRTEMGCHPDLGCDKSLMSMDEAIGIVILIRARLQQDVRFSCSMCWLLCTSNN
jgi:hypothetical protein